MKTLFCCVIFTFFSVCTSNKVHSQNRPKIDSTQVPVDEKGETQSNFWELFLGNILKNQRELDSLKKIRYDKTIYKKNYLKAYGIIPNADALALIDELNPDLGDSIQYGTPLKFPDLSRASSEERKEFRRDFQEFNRYDKEEHLKLKQQIDLLNQKYTSLDLEKGKLKADSSPSLNQFWVDLNLIHSFYNSVINTTASKGRMQLLNQNLATINTLLDNLSKKPIIGSYDLILLNFFVKNAKEKPSKSKTGSEENGYKKKGSNSGPSVDDLFEKYIQLEPENFHFEEPDINKQCYIYALETKPGTKIVMEMKGTYTYAFMGAGNAYWDCKKNKCTKFIDKQGGYVSMAQQEIAVADYVFRFTNVITGKVHWRCIKYEDFRLTDDKGNPLPRKKISFIFNPKIGDCNDFLW